MYLYLLTRRTENFGWDENTAMVVAAQTPKKARTLAARAAQDEGQHIWEDPELSSLRRIGTTAEDFGKPQVVLARHTGG